MDDQVGVYDLGEVRRIARERASARPDAPTGEESTAPAGTPTAPRAASRDGGERAFPAVAMLTASAALLLPGSGHLAQRRYVAGSVWMASFLSLLAAIAGSWAILPRLWAAASALGLRQESAVWLLGGYAVALIAVHLASLLTALSWERELSAGRSHPALGAGASLLLPGWGQLLNGHALRAALFLLVAWIAALAWVLASAPFQEMLVTYGLRLPEPLATLSGDAMRWALPAALWPLAVYDAAVWSWRGMRAA